MRTIKFLFLPAEHDPDSFIREFGADAFARFVGEATPLSRFMLEAAREGCDLGSAEGRAHLSSNIGPMWSALPEGALKRQLLGEIAKRFGLGYAPEGWRSLASVFPDYEEPLLVESGLVIASEEGDGKRYDRFRDRVMFPIRNVKGECIGFGGRVLGDEKPKYLNSPETPVFSKGRELYGLFEARTALREKGYALVTEGYMDVVALAQLGFPNTVATLGTACTGEHVHKLFRFTDSVVFSFDGDAAGRRAAR